MYCRIRKISQSFLSFLVACFVWMVISAVHLSTADAQDAVVGWADRTRAARVLSGVVSDDGQRLITHCQDDVLRIWNPQKGTLIDALRFAKDENGAGKITAWCSDPSHNELVVAVSGGVGKRPQLFRCQVHPTPKIVAIATDHQAKITALAYSNAGQNIISASEDLQVVIRDAKTLRAKVSQVMADRGHVTAILDFADDKLLFYSAKGYIGVCDHRNQISDVAWKPGHTDFVVGVAVVGERVFSAAADGSLCYTTASGKVMRSRNPDPSHALAGIAATGNDNELILVERIINATSQDTKLKVDLMDTSSFQTKPFPGSQQPFFVSASPQRERLVVADMDGVLEVLNAKTFRQEDALVYSARAMHAVRFTKARPRSPKNQAIVWGYEFKDLKRADEVPLKFGFDFENLDLIQSATGFKASNESLVRFFPEALAKQFWRGGSIDKIPAFIGVGFPNSSKEIRKKFFLQDESKLGIVYGTATIDDRLYIGADNGLYEFNIDQINDGQLTSYTRQLDEDTTLYLSTLSSDSAKYLLTYGHDNVVHLRNYRTGKKFLSLSVFDDQWVCWTPEGYYACSPNAERTMGWHVSNGPDELADFQPFEDFHENFYQPQLIQDIWQTGDVQASIKRVQPIFVNGKVPQPAADNLRPAVEMEILSVKRDQDGTFYTRDSEVKVVVRGTARSGGDIVNAEIKKGRHPVELANDFASAGIRFPTKSFEFQATIPLDPGLTELDVTCESSNYMLGSMSSPIRIHRKTSADSAEFRKLFALSVDVSEYKNFPPLGSPKNDADRIATRLKSGAAGLFIEAAQVDRLSPQNRSQVFDQLSEIREDFGSTDLLVIYWAGHGEVVNIQGKDEFVLIMPGSSKDSPQLEGIRSTDLFEQLGRFDGGRILLLLDSCHSGKLVSGFEDDLRKKMGNGIMDGARESRIMTIAACRSDQTAEAQDGTSHFGAALDLGLKGTRQTTRVIGSDQRKPVVLSELLTEFVRDEIRRRTSNTQESVSSGFQEGDPTPIVISLWK